MNPTYYKKNVTKLSIICDTNKIPLSITPFKSTTNDRKTIIDSINNTNIKKRVYLIGDKGYISTKFNRQVLLKKYKVKLITPRKKNQKNIRISKLMKSKLKIRNRVENCIQSIKSFNRISIRKDRKLINYMNFVYMACGVRFDKCTIKIN